MCVRACVRAYEFTQLIRCNQFEFRVFLLLDWLPSLPNYLLIAGGEKNRVTFFFAPIPQERAWIKSIHVWILDTRLAFRIALIHLGKIWVQLSSLRLWVNSKSDSLLYPLYGESSEFKPVKLCLKTTLCFMLLTSKGIGFGFVWFYRISTIVDHLIPNPFYT